jgi:hypothetical protein
MDVTIKREFLEVSFEEEFKSQQKKHKSLDPMKLNQKLISLLPNISNDRLGEKGKFFFDDEKESVKTVTEKTLTKLKRNSEIKEKQIAELRKTFENFKQKSNFQNKKKIINFSNLKSNVDELISGLMISRNRKKLNTVSNYSFNSNKIIE